MQQSLDLKCINEQLDQLKSQMKDIKDIKESEEQKQQIIKIEKQLKDGAAKTVTREANIIDLENNIGGTANITLEGNTIDIAKEPIISDFKDNINAGKHNHLLNYSSLLLPDSFPKSFANEAKNVMSKQDNICDDVRAVVNSSIPQALFSFNIIEIVERKLNISIGNNTTEKVAWLKKNVKSLICHWWGYGTCPSGNKAYLDAWDSVYSRWNMKHQNIQDGMSNKSDSPHIIAYGTKSTDYLTFDGFIHFLAYTDASDGVTQSVIYTDYVNIEIQLSPILKSVGEKENNKIEIKSVGKNLFNGIYEKKYTDGGDYYIANNNDTRIAFIKIEPNKTYCIKKYSASNRLTLGLYNSIDIGSLSLKPLIDAGNDALECSITNNVNAKYLSIYVSNNNEEPKLQVEEGDKATDYEDYKEDTVLYTLKEPLRGLPSGVRDTINTDGTITRRVGNIIFNDNGNWVKSVNENSSTIMFAITDFSKPNAKQIDNLICDKLTNQVIHDKTIEKEGIYSSVSGILYLRINKDRLTTQDIEGFKKWLKENPVTVYYELKEPITENIGQPLNLQTFKNGTVQVNTNVLPYTTIKYPTNINSRISTIEEANSNIKDSLGGAWQTLLILADKELKMKSIQPLSTSDDISKKINEIIGVW